MDPARGRIHQGREGVDVGALELREPAVGQHLARQLVVVRELLEHLLVGGIAGLGLLEDGQLELLEEHALELLG
jgi:hypothetical protein